MHKRCRHKSLKFGIVLIPILEDKTKITAVIRDKDGDWQVLDSVTPLQQDNATILCGDCIKDLLDRKELKELAKLPAGHRADLLTEDGPWIIRQHRDC